MLPMIYKRAYLLHLIFKHSLQRFTTTVNDNTRSGV